MRANKPTSVGITTAWRTETPGPQTRQRTTVSNDILDYYDYDYNIKVLVIVIFSLMGLYAKSVLAWD
jgi:hypothetical protein